MRRRQADIQVFSVSFLDVLSCALGGVLLLLLVTMSSSEQAKREAATMIGLKGDLKGVVFVFDTSGSMVQGGRFPEYQELLKRWVLNLSFERFNIIRFSTDVEAWREPGLFEATAANRRDAAQFIDGFTPAGDTNTLGALRKAFDLSEGNLDTIVLFSDGAPIQKTEDILQYLRERNTQGVVINTVAIGRYFQERYGVFLQQVAQQHNGMFIGR